MHSMYSGAMICQTAQNHVWTQKLNYIQRGFQRHDDPQLRAYMLGILLPSLPRSWDVVATDRA